MEYPHTPYDDIVPCDTAPAPGGDKGSLSLMELARSVLLSQIDPQASLAVQEIIQRIAAKNTHLVPGKKERWEKTLRETLRDHYCFIGHTQKGNYWVSYSCDSTVDPKLRKSRKLKRIADSAVPFAEEGGSTLVSEDTSCSRDVSLTPAARGESGTPLAESTGEEGAPPGKDRSSASSSEVHAIRSVDADLATDDDVSPFGTTTLKIDVSEIYERKQYGDTARVFFCQDCGPYRLLRQRWSGHIVTSSFRKLIQLLCGSQPGGQSLERLFGLSAEQVWPETITRELASEIVGKVQVILPKESILADTLPNLPNEAPPFFQRKLKSHSCRYCGETFVGRKYRTHLLKTRGTCQLQHASQLRHYLGLLNTSLDEDASHNDKSGDESAGEEEMGLDENIRPILQPAFTAWTEDEINQFFYALSRFSRFRPDAIAECIRTKNEIEVNALLKNLKENAALLFIAGEPEKTKPAPAAREMSQKWLKIEESLAEDAIVWEAFVEQAMRTPPEYRDIPQQDVTRRRMYVSCSQCVVQICDGHWPVCNRCKDQGLQCSWPANLIRRHMPDMDPQLLTAVKEAYPDYQPQMSQKEAIRTEFIQSMSWYHLVSLSTHLSKGSLRSRLDLMWWKAASAVKTPKHSHSAASSVESPSKEQASARLRKSLIEAMVRCNCQDLSLVEKEALYQHIKQAHRENGHTMLEYSELLALRFSPSVLAERGRIEEALSEEHSSQRSHLKKMRLRSAYRWADIPISHVSSQRTRNQPEYEQIHEEIQQAHKQLEVVHLNSEDLGREAELFDLRSVGTLLDLYRQGSQETAHISKQTLHDLYILVRRHTTRVLTLALSIADSKDVDYSTGGSSRPDKLANCVKEAHTAIDMQSSGSNKSRIPKIFKDLMETPISVLGYATKNDIAGVRSNTSLLSTILKSRPKSDVQNSRQKALEFETEPLDYRKTAAWDPELVSSDDEEDEGDYERVEGSPAGTEFIQLDVPYEMVSSKTDDTKVEEEDRLEDAIYEHELWDLINGAGSAVKSADSPGQTGKDGALPGVTDDGDSDGISESGIDLLADLSQSEEESELDIRANSSDEEGELLSQASTLSARHEGGRKRLRTSATSYKRIGSDEHDGGSGRKHKPKYRTQEFISTSDEEED